MLVVETIGKIRRAFFKHGKSIKAITHPAAAPSYGLGVAPFGADLAVMAIQPRSLL
jgi:hypothetical protein